MSELSRSTRILVREVMNSPVITAEPNTPVNEVASLMEASKVGSVVIIEEERPLGIVTDGDIVEKVVAKNLKPSEVKAGDVMSTPLHTTEATREITDVARLMRKLHVKRLGVLYRDKLIGMVSVSDLIAVTPELVDIVSEKARIMSGEPSRSRGTLAGYCDFCNQWSDYLLEVDGRFVCDECRAETLVE